MATPTISDYLAAVKLVDEYTNNAMRVAEAYFRSTGDIAATATPETRWDDWEFILESAGFDEKGGAYYTFRDYTTNVHWTKRVEVEGLTA